MNKFKDKVCYYCGDVAVSEDHLPPSCIFPEPKPQNRIKVPSCKEHNSSQSMDDEYFRWFVASASFGDPSAEKVIMDKIVPQFKKNGKLLQAILNHSSEVNIISEAGLYL